MAETFGGLELRLSQLPHGASIHQDVLDGFVNDRTQALIAFHPWQRLNVNAMLQTPASFTTGTVAVANGSTSVVLTGGSFTSAMTGRRFRADNQPQFYTFTFVDANDGTIDRPYEGPTVTAGAVNIWQAIYVLPENVDFFQSIECPRLLIDLDQTTQELLDLNDAGRQLIPDQIGTGPGVLAPLQFAPYQDDPVSGNSQIELYPGPVVAEGLPTRYRAKLVRFNSDTDAAKAFPDWIDTGVIAAGVEADLYALAGNMAMVEKKEKDWENGLMRMVTQDNQRVVPQQMRMASRWVQHRIDRATGGDELREIRYQQM